MAPRHSLAVRLPLAVGFLLLATLAGFALAARFQVRGALQSAAETRLESASSRLGALLATSAPQLMAALDTLAADATLRRFLREPSRDTGEVRAFLDSATAAVAARRALVALAADGRRLTGGVPGATAFVAEDGVSGTGPLVAVGDTVGYAMTVVVLEGADTLGTLAEVRILTANPQGAALISDLIGQNATFLLGNRSGDVWTDLAGRAPTPAGAARGARLDADDVSAPTLGVAAPIEGTPWMQWVALPATVVSDPLAAFTARLALLGALFVAAGAVGAWLMGRRIARPLVRLTGAAEAVAAGDFSRRIAIDRQDEVGRLGHAFGVMSARVSEARDRLEERVEARTAQLSTALAELEEAQEELVRKERLALLGELAGGVGHELRNPLGVMTNAVFYLEAVMKDRTRDVDDYLGILRKQIATSERIVGDLLDFARVKPPQRRSTPLRQLVDEQFGRVSVPEGIHVRKEFPPELPAAWVDPGQVGQVVLNLITNAVQAMDDEGTLTLRGWREGERVLLEVEDDGPGMDVDTLERIFEPLFTTKARGIGLGLSVSRSLAEANGGDLAAESRPGEGATFRLSLPAQEAA